MGIKTSLITFFTSYISCKVIYFLEFASLSCLLPYITIYLRVGASLEPWYIGILTSLIPFMSFIFTPLWTLVTDKYNNHRVVLIGSCIMTGVFLILLLLVGSNVFGVFLATLCYAIAASPICPLVDFLVIQKLDTDRQLYGQQRLWGAISWGIVSFITGYLIDVFNNIHIIVYCYVIWMLIFSATVFFLNFKSTTTKLFQQIKNLEVIHRSSKNLKSLLSTGTLKSNNNSANSSNNDLSTIASGVSTPNQPEEDDDSNSIESNNSNQEVVAQMILEMDQVEEGKNRKHQQKQSLLQKEEEEEENNKLEDIDIHLNGADTNTNLNKDKVSMKIVLRGVITNTPFMLFLFAITITGMAQTIISNFLFLFLKDHLNASTTLLGATLPFTVVMELPFFFFGKQLLERIGVKWMIAIGHIAFIIRLIAYNMFAIPNISAWWVVVPETLHGIAFSSIWIAGIEYSAQMAEKGYQATYQGIFAGINGGLGSGLGSIIGGFIYQHIGPMALWRFAACSTTISLIIFLVSSIYFNPAAIKHQPKKNDIESINDIQLEPTIDQSYAQVDNDGYEEELEGEEIKV